MMRHFGWIAVFFAICLGGWSTVGYFQTVSERQQNVAAMQRVINRELRGGSDDSGPFDRDRELHYWQMGYEALFVVAGCFLIVGGELLWHSRKAAHISRATAERSATFTRRF